MLIYANIAPLIINNPPMSTLNLEWFQSHPYVQEWRQQNCNSFFPTVESLNNDLNIHIDNPITLGRVSEIVGDYLLLLVRDVKRICNEEKLPRNRQTVAERFQLNRTETKFILNNLIKQTRNV